MSDFQDTINGLLEDLESDHPLNPAGSIARIPVKPEWKQKFHELSKVKKEAVRCAGLLDTLHKNVWSEIELETGHYVNNMRYNHETGIIEVFASPIDDEN